MTETIRPVDPAGHFKKHLADCIIVLSDGRLYMQQGAGRVHPFGGHVEDGEAIVDAVIREIMEETGGMIDAENLVFIGAVTEAETGHTEAVHVYFWHDAKGTVTGCYEREPVWFDSVKDALAHPGLMDYARWAVMEARQRRLIK